MDEKLTILVVDDEPFNVDYLVQELEDFGVNTITAADGLEALDQVSAHSPDLILLDIMMPRMDGFDVLAKLKSNEDQRNIPVIIISANSDMKNVLKGIELGAEDYLPKPFDPLLLKARVNASLEKKRFRNLEQKYLESLERELHIGRDIQSDFLPEKLPSIDGWDFEVFFRAAKEVSGDFYDIIELVEGKFAFIVGDVTDKGVGAALYMALYRSLIRAYILEKDASEISSKIKLEHAIKETNKYICANHAEPHFLTVFAGVIDPQSGRLDYISAGHDHPFMVDAKRALTEIKPTGPLIGMTEDADFKVDSIQFEKNAMLFLYTDGVLDLINENEERFGESRLKEAVMEKKAPGKLISYLVDQLERFSGQTSQFDDLTMLAIQRK